MSDDDPFGAFGDDSDDEGDVVAISEAAKIAASLRDQVNQKLSQAGNGVSSDEGKIGQKEESQQTELAGDVDLSHLQPLEIASWDPPAYHGPMQLVQALSVGGGRGYVASHRLEPGTLLLLEEPIMTWPASQLGGKLDLNSVQNILEHPNGGKIIHDMEDFHPTKQDVDRGSPEENTTTNSDAAYQEQITKMFQLISSEELFEEAVVALVELAESKSLTNRKDGTSLSKTDILRLLVALRYNGLESGVYKHVAMLNHACRPNCVKFLPTSDQQKYSEVRTTRVVQAGESLTISYMPRIVSHASRRKHLWDQHRFDIGADYLKGDVLKMEQVHNALPTSAVMKWDEESITHRIELATEEMENLHHETASAIADGDISDQTWETTKAMEMSSLELYTRALEELQNNRHILLIPILSLHLETCQLVQRAPGLSKTTQLGIVCRLIVTARELLSLQESFLGTDHFDLARTNNDLAQAVAEVLSRSPQHLIKLDLPSLKTFNDWSRFQHTCQKEYERIKALYPEDATSFLEKNQS